MKRKKADSSVIDADFEAGASVLRHFDLSSATRPNKAQMRVNVDFPLWMVDELDREAARVGVTRQSIIKVWLAERLAAVPKTDR